MVLVRMEENEEKVKVTRKKEKQDLPQDIIHDMLRRLPGKSLHRFKSICKNWCNTISHPDFEELNVQQLMSKIRINVYSPKDAHHAYKCASFELQEKGSSAKQLTSFYLTPKFAVWIEDSFSNLLLYRAHDPVGMPFKINLYVFDTVTHELKHLPEIKGCYDHTSRCSFICIESTKQYKLIIFQYYELLSLAAMCSFFSLNNQNNNKWRAYKLPGFQRVMKSCSLISLNGVLHWIAQDFGSHFGAFIQTMDIETEVFMRIIEVPCQPCAEYSRAIMNYNLLEIKGSLGLMKAASHDELVIWVLKDSVRSQWIQQHKIFVLSMVHRPSCLTSFIYDIFQPLLVLESCKTTYLMVAVGGESKLYWYNMETKELMHIAISSDSISTCSLRTIYSNQ